MVEFILDELKRLLLESGMTIEGEDDASTNFSSVVSQMLHMQRCEIDSLIENCFREVPEWNRWPVYQALLVLRSASALVISIANLNFFCLNAIYE